MSKSVLLRWRTNKKEFCKIVQREDLCSDFLAVASKHEDVFVSMVEDLNEIIRNAESIFWDADNVKKQKIPVVLEYWYADGNTSQYTVEPEEMTTEIKEILEKVLFKKSEDDGKYEIPENIRISWLTNGERIEKVVSRRDVMSIFNPYIYTDAMNNGIAKRIMAVIPYSLSWYIAWDNPAEINSLFYEVGEPCIKKSITIPGIHRKIWGELKKLCDM